MKRKSKQTEKHKKLLKSTSNDSIATLKNEKELSEYLVVELRELLKDLGLDTKGKKAELIKRLEKARSTGLGLIVADSVDVQKLDVKEVLNDIPEPAQNIPELTKNIPKEVETMILDIPVVPIPVEYPKNVLEQEDLIQIEAPVLDSDSIFVEEVEPEVIHHKKCFRKSQSGQAKPEEVQETFYCVLCGTTKEMEYQAGQVVLHFLKPVVRDTKGDFVALKLPIPPLIPEEYKESTTLCDGCVERNAHRDVLKPLQVDMFKKSSLPTKLPVFRSFQNSENEAPKRTGYQKVDPDMINTQIRNSPVHHSLLAKPVPNYTASPLRSRLKGVSKK